MFTTITDRPLPDTNVERKALLDPYAEAFRRHAVAEGNVNGEGRAYYPSHEFCLIFDQDGTFNLDMLDHVTADYVSTVKVWAERTLSLADFQTLEEGADRTATGQALATMRRREADAKRDAARLLQEKRDLEAQIEAMRQAPSVPTGPTTLQELKRHYLWTELATEAAYAADEAGFCSEYDRMAGLIGLPDRDDVMPTRSFTRTVTFTVTVTEEYEEESRGDGAPSEYVDVDTVASEIRSVLENGDYVTDVEVSLDGTGWGGNYASWEEN
jgi:hypothetical protein